MCISMCLEMCIDMCIDMCLDMCIYLREDMCLNMSIGVRILHRHVYRFNFSKHFYFFSIPVLWV